MMSANSKSKKVIFVLICRAASTALGLLLLIKYALPEAVRQEGDLYIFLWLTATPTAHPTYTATPSSSSRLALPTLTPGQSLITESPTPQITPTTPNPTATSLTTDLPGLNSTPTATQPVSDTATSVTPPVARSSRLPFCGSNIGMIVSLFFAGWLWKSKRGIKHH